MRKKIVHVSCYRLQFQLPQALQPPPDISPIKQPNEAGETSANQDTNAAGKSDLKQETHEVHEHERYPIATIEFSRVETPFIIGVWILFASIAKIGESVASVRCACLLFFVTSN